MAFVDENNYTPNDHLYKGYQLTKEEVLAALVNTTSIKEAARSMNISYPTFKKYAKMYVDLNTGKSLLEKFKNPSGKGVKRNYDGNVAVQNPKAYFKNGQRPTPERIAKLKSIVVSKKIVDQYCQKCGYHERRLTDMRQPLMLNFKNKNKSDWRVENLEMVCYNCYFLYVGDPLTHDMVKQMESHNFEHEIHKDKLEEFHQIDEIYMDHLKQLGLDGEGDVIETIEDLIDYEDEDGSEFVDHV